ncbi:MAG: ABC transporter permease [Saprospiraceae bacterium]|nr:ABC transporter permease [Saprospiraceae bacterium]
MPTKLARIAFGAFIQKEWKHIFRDRKTILILFGMPLVQILIFGFALSNEVKHARIAVFDQSNDSFSQELVKRLDASRHFDVVARLNHPSEVQEAFQAGEIRLVVVIPPGFENALHAFHRAPLQLLADGSDPNLGTTVVHYAASIVAASQEDLLGQQSLPYGFETELRMMFNPQLEAAYNFVPGVMAMILLLICAMMTSVAIVREKENGNMEVLLVSPVKPLWIILAKTIPYLVLSTANICSILLLSYFVLDVPVRGSVPLLIGGSLIFTVTALSLGMFVSSIAHTQTVAMFGTLVGLFLPSLMFSDFMFPVDNMPEPLRLISYILPSRWYFYIVKSVMIKGLGLAGIWKELLILSGMTLVLLLVSIRKFDNRLAL